MHGLLSYGAYLPHWRLERSAITEVMGSGGGRGTRSVANFDEDTTSMGVEAARAALAPVGGGGSDGARVDDLIFATAEPAYHEKTNATAVWAALRLGPDTGALDATGAVRSGAGSLRLALRSPQATLVVASGIRTGLPTSADESTGGDGACAFLTGEGSADTPVIAELLGSAVATDEFVDRWRTPGDTSNRSWEERFGETVYVPLATDAWARALEAAGLGPEGVDVAIVTGVHARSARRLGGKLGVEVVADDLADSVGNTGAAHPGLVLASVLDEAGPGRTIALVTLASGVEVLVLRTTDAIAGYTPHRPVAAQLVSGASLPYAKFLAFRGVLTPEPPNRPAPSRPSSSIAHRREDWKFGYVGSRDKGSGAVHLPPSRVSFAGGAVDDMADVPMADVLGTVSALTVDRLAYSPSPPIVFAVVDFDGGGRNPVELTDVTPDDVAVGDRVEMTFRRLYTADGIHNYFWKARPVGD